MTVYQNFDIQQPVWKTRSVGLASYKVGANNKVRILARRKDGSYIYAAPNGKPQTYYVSGATVKQCPTQTLSNNVVLSLVPISKLEILEDGLQ